MPADGANFALAIHCQDDLVVVQEIIPPQLACIASLTGISRHIALSAEGEPFEQQRVGLGLSYDHRIINGRTADAVLLRLKKLIEEPEAEAAARPDRHLNPAEAAPRDTPHPAAHDNNQ